MQKILAVAELTFRKIEEAAFLLLLLAAVLGGYMVSEFDTVSFGNDLLFGGISQNIIKGTPILGGFLCVTSVAVLISAFYGVTDIPREINNGCIMLIIGKPISRKEYFIGKFVGIIAISALIYAFSITALLVGHFIKTGSFFSFNILFRNLLLFLAVLPLTSITMMFSTFLADISAMIISAVYLGMAIAVSMIPVLSQMLPKGTGMDVWLYMIYYIFPNFYHFFIPLKFTGFVFPAMIIYATSSTAIFLTLGILRIDSKDLI